MSETTSLQSQRKVRPAPSANGRLLQRTCDCGKHTSDSGDCGACKKSHQPFLQRSAISRATNSHDRTAPAIVHDVLRSPGQPLDADTRKFFESRFSRERTTGATGTALSSQSGIVIGAQVTDHEMEADRVAETVMQGSLHATMGTELPRDFSRVRIHTDSKAAESAQSVIARAYTVGTDIVFNKGEYSPHTNAGRRLLAHELAHVTQQSTSGTATALLQRTIGDGHDLRAPRFAGDLVLEACFDNERLLRAGSRGPAVTKLQRALIDAGFTLPTAGVDGIFGPETEAAVRSYQRAHLLTADSVVGPITMGALDSQFAVAAPPPPPATITSATVATSPGSMARTNIGVGEDVVLTHSAGSVAWTTTAGTLSSPSGARVTLTAPDTAQRVTVTGGGVPKSFDVIAPTGVHMDRSAGTGIKHTVDRPNCGIQTLPFLLPDTVNFQNVVYRELDVAGVPTAGAYSCNPFAHGHCGAGGGGAPCSDLFLTNTVVTGKGTQAVRGDCAYSGHCGAPSTLDRMFGVFSASPFSPGSVVLSIPHQYKVGTGRYRTFTNVTQQHTLGPDRLTLTTDKAGAHGQTTVTAPTSAIAACP